MLAVIPVPGAAFEPVDLASGAHVVTGQIREVFNKGRDEDPPTFVTRHLIEVVVDKVEKGQGLEPGKLLYVHTYSRANHKQLLGKALPGIAVPGYVPKEGDWVRLYLARGTDGAYRVLMNADTIQRLDSPKKN